MAAPPCDKPVPYCSCTMRRVNLDGNLTNTTCDWCERLVPDDKAIYLVLKDHVRHLQLLGSNKKVKWKKMKKKKNKTAEEPIMDAIESLPDREDIQELLTKYEAGVLRASVRVLVKHDSLDLRSLLSSICRDLPPSAEPEEVASGEAGWDATPEPAAEQTPPCDYLCEPEIATQDYREMKDAEPEAIEKEYVEVQDMEEKSFDDDPLLSSHDDDYGDKPTSNKPVDSDREEGPVGNREAPVKDATPSDESNGEERAQEKEDMICLPFDSQYKLVVQLQGVLERACFAYAQRRLPTLLRERKWSYAEAVPLHTWMDEFAIIRYTFDTEPSRELLKSVTEIEDTAVKRTPMDWSRTEKLLDNAVELTEVLQTEEYGEFVKKIRVDVAKAIKDLRHQEEEFQNDEMNELLCIYLERKELDDREKLAWAEKKRKTRECQQSAGSKVLEAIEEAKVIFEMPT